MSEVFIAEVGAYAELQQALIELRGSDTPLEITVRQLGEHGLIAARMYVHSIFITEDRDPSFVVDEQSGPVPTVCIARGQASVNGSDLHTATLTLREQASVTTPGCELEVNDQTDIG